jgi:hypothetical protein
MVGVPARPMRSLVGTKAGQACHAKRATNHALSGSAAIGAFLPQQLYRRRLVFTRHRSSGYASFGTAE